MAPGRKKRKTANPNSNGDNENTNKRKKKFVEPEISWQDSNAKKELYNAIMSNDIPSTPNGVNKHGHTMTLKDIFHEIPELAFYDYTKLSSRLSSLRATVKALNGRAEEDQRAFDKFKQLHPPSLCSKKGYIHWQGSEAKVQLKKDIVEGVLDELGKKELWGSRPVYYENFPLDVFRDKVKQYVRTKKYIHTLKEKGKLHKAS